MRLSQACLLSQALLRALMTQQTPEVEGAPVAKPMQAPTRSTKRSSELHAALSPIMRQQRGQRSCLDKGR